MIHPPGNHPSAATPRFGVELEEDFNYLDTRDQGADTGTD
jgi:hypothetical protein